MNLSIWLISLKWQKKNILRIYIFACFQPNIYYPLKLMLNQYYLFDWMIQWKNYVFMFWYFQTKFSSFIFASFEFRFIFWFFFHIKFIDNQIHFYLVSRDLNLNLNFKLIIECMKNIAWKSNVTIWHFQIYLTDVKSSLFDCFMIFHQIYFHFNITFIHYLNNYKNS